MRRKKHTRSGSVVPCYIITSYLAGDYIEELCNIIAPAALMVLSKAPWLLRRDESIVPSHIGLENHNVSFSISLSTRCNYRRVKL